MFRIENQLKTVALLGALSLLLVLLGSAISPGAMWLFGGLAVALNFASYFWSDRLVLRMNRAREIARADDPELFGIVEALAARGGIPVPRVYVVDDPSPNAFATGRNPAHAAVAVTTGIRRLLTPRELAGVLGHELSHVRHRDILIASVAAMIASVVSMLASMVRWGAIFGGLGDRDDRGGGNVLGELALAIVAPIAATVIQLGISRSREYLADEGGARLTGDPLALASALAKLERGNARVPMQTGTPATQSLYICAPAWGGGVTRWFSTHPPIEERIRRLEELASSTSPARAAMSRG